MDSKNAVIKKWDFKFKCIDIFLYWLKKFISLTKFELSGLQAQIYLVKMFVYINFNTWANR